MIKKTAQNLDDSDLEAIDNKQVTSYFGLTATEIKADVLKLKWCGMSFTTFDSSRQMLSPQIALEF